LKFSQEVGKYFFRHNKWVGDFSQPIYFAVAGVTRLELAAFPSGMTGRSNQIFYVITAFAVLDSILTLNRITSF
jgi:hypothetical protein